MKHPRNLIIIALVLVLCTAAFAACRSHKKSHAFALDYISEALDLTESQQTTLKEIQQEVEVKVEALHDNRSAMRDALKTQIAADRMDKAEIQKLVDRHRDEMNGIIDLVVDRLVVFHETLTPVQKEKLIKKIETFESWRNCRS